MTIVLMLCVCVWNKERGREMACYYCVCDISRWSESLSAVSNLQLFQKQSWELPVERVSWSWVGGKDQEILNVLLLWCISDDLLWCLSSFLNLFSEKSPVVSGSTFCPSGWTGYNGRCFLYVPTPRTWADAEVISGGVILLKLLIFLMYF